MRIRIVVGVIAAVAVLYMILLGYRGLLLIGEGDLLAVTLGVAVLVFPLVAAYLVWREIRFGIGTERLGRQLASEGGLPRYDDLPRRPSGRADRAAADAAFDRAGAQAEAAPDDWRSWFRLGVAYDQAGDRRRARAALRHAIDLHGSEPTPNPGPHV